MTSGIPAPKPRPEYFPPGPQPVAPPPAKPRRRWWLAALAVALAAAAALYLRSLQVQPSTGSGPPVVSITAQPVVAGDLERTIRLTGATAALNYADLKIPQMGGGRGTSLSGPTSLSTGARGARGASGSGGGGGGPIGGIGGRSGFQGEGLTIVWLVPAGSRVNKGDRLAEIDREEMLTRLEDFKTTVSQTEAAMKTLDAQREVIKKTQAQTIRDAVADVDKASLDLKTTPVVSRIAAEQLRLSTEQAEATHKQIMGEVPLMETSLAAQWRMAELALGERTLELKRVQANLDRMTMRAPISGLVVMGTTRRGGEIGQIREGDSLDSGESLMKVVDLSSMIVEASVNQVDAELIRIGAKARVHFDAFPDLEVPAEVYSIGALSKSASSQGRAEYVKGVPITLRLLKVDPRVIPDLSVGVDVVLAREPQTVIAPREAIFQDAPESKPFVFVQQDSGWVRREVELGPANYVSTAVRSGLRAGEVVACERPRNQTAGKK